jgi:Kef-type K+ transport system membrane component KefB
VGDHVDHRAASCDERASKPRGPKRLFTQMRGLADGFFIPLFFVVLGPVWELGALMITRRSCASPPRC